VELVVAPVVAAWRLLGRSSALATSGSLAYLSRVETTAGPHVVAVLMGPVICLLSMAEGARRIVPSGTKFACASQSATAC
jgi:hypothetical protein